jgi:hypothetical protein
VAGWARPLQPARAAHNLAAQTPPAICDHLKKKKKIPKKKCDIDIVVSYR